MKYEIGDKVRILLKHPKKGQCSGCGDICPFYNKVGTIKEINYNRTPTHVWVTELRDSYAKNSGCSGFILKDIEPYKITNWKKVFEK